jgi:hypothetical protein
LRTYNFLHSYFNAISKSTGIKIRYTKAYQPWYYGKRNEGMNPKRRYGSLYAHGNFEWHAPSIKYLCKKIMQAKSPT